MKPLRILHLLAGHKWTGPAEGVVTLCRGLRERGHQVSFFCSPDSRRLLADKAEAVGVRPETDLWLRPNHPILCAIDIRRLKEIVIREKADLLHLHLSSDHWIGALSARWAALPTRVVRTIHHPDSIRPRLFRRRLYESMTDGIITLSDADRRRLLLAYRLEGKPVAVIHGAVDASRFHPDLDPRPIRAEFGIGTSAPVLGIVARFQAHRRHELLLEAFVQVRRSLPTARLLLVGKGEHRPAVEEAVRQLRLQNAVVFTGYRDRDLPSVYAAMNVKVFLASGSDASCRAVLEAMACGLPVVAHPVGALPETILDGVTGRLVPEGEIDGLARRLVELLGDRDRARKMGLAGRQRVEENFTEDRRVESTERFYSSLTAGG
jgi:glycosyltransferase involved in cell wall biosynthesis